MALIDLGIGTYLKIGIAVAAAASVGLAYWHYTSVVGDLAKAQAQVTALTTERDQAIKLANDNAVAVLRADKQRQNAVDALEQVQAEKSKQVDAEAQARADIAATPRSTACIDSPAIKALAKALGGAK